MRKMSLLLLMLVFTSAYAQEKQASDVQRQTLEELFQTFSLTNNAAGMGLSQPSAGSQTQLSLFDQTGDYHLAQQGDTDYGFKFSTLRYDSFSDKLFMRGSFYYSLDREKNRSWSDVMNPWFSIPYIYASAVAKDYDSHKCGLSFDLYTAPLWDKLSFGIRTEYKVADISGMRDPRPRTGYLNYQLVPSVLLTLGRHHLGLDLGYGYNKEKLSGLTTIQSYPNLYYYKMTGLEHVDGAISAYSGFKRQFVGGRVLGDLSYSYEGDAMRVLVSGGMEYEKMDAYGDKMQSPGSYNCFTYNALANLILTPGGGILHRILLKGEYGDAGADELLQELTSEKDPVTGATTETWVTLYEYKNRYMLKTLDASFSYKIYGTDGYSDYRWSAGLGAAWNGFTKEYFLPYSGFQNDALTLSLEGSVRLLAVKGHKVDLSASGAWRKPVRTALSLSDEDNIYAQDVLRPDRDYYAKDVLCVSGSLLWQFPLKLGKAGPATGYVRLDGGFSKAMPEGSLARMELSVGLFTF